jgi:hypothetical protein
MTKDDPRILLFDIETTPALFAGYRLGKSHITYDQIVKRPQVLCISWAWGDGKVQHASLDMKKFDWYKKDDDADLELIKKFTAEARKATVVVGHNGRFFDVSFLRSRIVKYQIEDFNPTLIDDTYLSSKPIGFISHKLDDLGDYFGYGGKAEHGKGLEWWIEVIRGNKSILNKMMHYCDVDVIKLRKIYKHLKPYVKSSLNLAVFYERPDACPSCGQSSRPLIIRKYITTDAGKYPQLQCPVCTSYVPITKGKNGLVRPSSYNRVRGK